MTPILEKLLLLAEVLAASALLSFGAHADWQPNLRLYCSANADGGETCDPDAVAKALRALSLRHPTDDADERDFLSTCEDAVWALTVVSSQEISEANELELLRRDHPTDDEKRDRLRFGERAVRHAEAFLDSLRSMAASWCPNVTAYRDAIPEAERGLSQMKWGFDGLRRMTPGAAVK